MMRAGKTLSVPEHQDDLRKSGLTEETIVAAGIFSVPPDGWRDLVGFTRPPDVTSGYAIPYGHDFYRIKIFPPLARKQGTTKYLQRPGPGCRLYVPPQVSGRVENVAESLYITEGEKKALLLVQLGFTAVAIGGLWNFAVKGELIPDLKRLPWPERPVFLVPDSDIWIGRDDLLHAVAAFGLELMDLGAQVSVMVVPQS